MTDLRVDTTHRATPEMLVNLTLRGGEQVAGGGRYVGGVNVGGVGSGFGVGGPPVGGK